MECLTELEDPTHQHSGLEEGDDVASAERHNAKWPLLDMDHVDELSLYGRTPRLSLTTHSPSSHLPTRLSFNTTIYDIEEEQAEKERELGP